MALTKRVLGLHSRQSPRDSQALPPPYSSGVLLTNGAGGTGKSYQTGVVAVALSCLQGKKVLVIASQRKVVDGITANIRKTFCGTGVLGPIIRVYHFRTKRAACRRVITGMGLEGFKTQKGSK